MAMIRFWFAAPPGAAAGAVVGFGAACAGCVVAACCACAAGAAVGADAVGAGAPQAALANTSAARPTEADVRAIIRATSYIPGKTDSPSPKGQGCRGAVPRVPLTRPPLNGRLRLAGRMLQDVR